MKKKCKRCDGLGIVQNNLSDLLVCPDCLGTGKHSKPKKKKEKKVKKMILSIDIKNISGLIVLNNVEKVILTTDEFLGLMLYVEYHNGEYLYMPLEDIETLDVVKG